MEHAAPNASDSPWMPWGPGAVFAQQADLTFRRVSPRLVEWTGVPAERWAQDKELFLQSVAAEDRPKVREQIARAARSPDGLSHQFRLRHAQTGRLTPLAEFRRALLDERGQVQGYDGFWLDLSRRAQIETRLAAATWKEALSAITLGVLHDFNNALTGVLSLGEHFLAQTDAGHPFHEGLVLIRQNTYQAAQLAHQLMRLHHARGGRRELRDLNAVARELAELLRRFIPKRIALATDLAAEPLPVEVDEVELQRVIIYLAQNAAEAIAERGTIRLQTSRQADPPRLRHFAGQPPRGASACLAVADTGAGIAPAHLDRIFEPFFTTKAPDTASGLGLHHARRFAEQHGGALSVESSPGAGATLRLWLPLVALT